MSSSGYLFRGAYYFGDVIAMDAYCYYNDTDSVASTVKISCPPTARCGNNAGEVDSILSPGLVTNSGCNFY